MSQETLLNVDLVRYFYIDKYDSNNRVYVWFGGEDRFIIDETMEEINSLILKARFTDYIASMPDVS